jgi:hypothetical protein
MGCSAKTSDAAEVRKVQLNLENSDGGISRQPMRSVQTSRPFASLSTMFYTEDVARFRVEAESVSWFDPLSILATPIGVGEKVLFRL